MKSSALEIGGDVFMRKRRRKKNKKINKIPLFLLHDKVF